MTSPEPPTVEPTSSFTPPESQDPASAISDLVDQADQSLSPRILALWRTGWTIAGLVLVALALIAAVAATDLAVPVRIAIPALVAVDVVLVVAWLPPAIYRCWSYRLT